MSKVPKYRGSWEGECLVDGCQEVCHIDGQWGDQPKTPTFFWWTPTDSNLPESWIFQPHRYLAHSIPVNRGLYCPTHAPKWLEYETKVRAWEQRMRQSKSFLLAIFRFKLLQKDEPPPVPPLFRSRLRADEPF